MDFSAYKKESILDKLVGATKRPAPSLKTSQNKGPSAFEPKPRKLKFKLEFTKKNIILVLISFLTVIGGFILLSLITGKTLPFFTPAKILLDWGIPPDRLKDISGGASGNAGTKNTNRKPPSGGTGGSNDDSSQSDNGALYGGCRGQGQVCLSCTGLQSGIAVTKYVNPATGQLCNYGDPTPVSGRDSPCGHCVGSGSAPSDNDNTVSIGESCTTADQCSPKDGYTVQCLARTCIYLKPQERTTLKFENVASCGNIVPGTDITYTQLCAMAGGECDDRNGYVMCKGCSGTPIQTGGACGPDLLGQNSLGTDCECYECTVQNGRYIWVQVPASECGRTCDTPSSPTIPPQSTTPTPTPTPVPGRPNLYKTVSGACTDTGYTANYRLTVMYPDDPAQTLPDINYNLVDQLDAGVSTSWVNNVSNSGVVDSTAKTITWNNQTIAEGTTNIYTYTIDFPLTAINRVYNNTATLTYNSQTLTASASIDTDCTTTPTPTPPDTGLLDNFSFITGIGLTLLVGIILGL